MGGEGAEAERRQDAVADLEQLDSGADRGDGPRQLAPRREGRRDLDLVGPRDEEGVDEVHSGGGHLHDDLALAGDRIGLLDEDEVLGRAPLGAHDALHARTLRGQPGRRSKARVNE